MSVIQWFTLYFLLTLAALVLAAVSGFRAKRVAHVTFVVSALALLGGTVYYALELGKIYDLESAGVITPIHLTLAKITTVAYLLPIIAGLRTIYFPSAKRMHRRLAYLALALTLVTAITGTWMILAATPLSPV